jgi:transcriptional regulator with XRE-family HTH domain
MAATKDGPAAPEPTEDIKTGSGAPTLELRTLERALGGQVRQLRRQHDLSVAELAGAANISAGMLSKIENGQISPSLATLQSISAALGTPLSGLFAAFEERQDCSYVRADQSVIMERRGTKAGHVYELLGHALRGDIAVEPFLITLKEDAVPHIGFQHAGMEFIYMLSGEVVYRHGDKTYDLKPGDALLFDSGALHGPETLIVTPMRYISVIIYPRAPT